MSVSLIMPTFNGLSLLQKHLPALQAAKGVCDSELIIADDGSTDGTAAWLHEHVPQAIVIALGANGGFSVACNAAIRAATGEFLVLLNNDVEVDSDFLAPLLRPFADDPQVFAVNSRILLPSQNMLDEGEKTGGFHHGLFYVDCQRDPANRSATTAPTLYATACAAAYRRTMVEQLAGFDDLYSPCYWEDVDLSYRALKRGWKVLYEPASVVYHEHETTTRRMDKRYTTMVKHRNAFLFVWKNISDARWTFASVALGPWVGLFHRLRDNDPAVLRGWWGAVRSWREVLPRRNRERRESVVTDRQILERFV